jgi:16S rRNA (cytosine967-C5)-methyltransferase
LNPRLNYYISLAEKLINEYNHELPFSYVLKNYFSNNKKHGSKDRKTIANICFSYFRIGKAAFELEFLERVKISIFLCNESSAQYSELFEDKFKNNWANDIKTRIDFIKDKFPTFCLDDVFPLHNFIGIEQKTDFILSHFVQPNLFLRIRNNCRNSVLEKLNKSKIEFIEVEHNSISLKNSTKIETVLDVNLEVVIQDLSSQKISEFYDLIKDQFKNSIHVWDCCSASGGKSILAVDVFKNIKLNVSDIRPTIIENLKRRFKEAKIKEYNSFVANLSSELQLKEKFDLIICDVPCSGSGTWGRTPEMLHIFDSDMLNKYVDLQKKIVLNTIKNLNKNGYFLYITCSIFSDENENNVDYFCKRHELKIVKSSYIAGFKKRADSMFAALLKHT